MSEELVINTTTMMVSKKKNFAIIVPMQYFPTPLICVSCTLYSLIMINAFDDEFVIFHLMK